MVQRMTISGVDLELHEKGAGRPLLFLHPGEGLHAERPWFDMLAKSFRVIAPCHPGWGTSSLPDWMSSVDDLALLYLDLADSLDLKDAILAGNSFGGWIAAEMAIRNTQRFAKLVLAAPLGIKVTGREVRDITDMHGIARADYLKAAWADPAKGHIDYAKLPDMELAGIARGREALALFGWKPYMHNPRLKPWLHRIKLPTLLFWGAQDGMVTPAYREGWQTALPAANVDTIAACGHYPQWEQPAAFAERVVTFAK